MARQKLEYKVIEGNPDLETMETELTALGIRGWEVCAISSVRLPMPVESKAGATGHAMTDILAHTIVLRRPLITADTEQASTPPSPPPPSPAPQST